MLREYFYRFKKELRRRVPRARPQVAATLPNSTIYQDQLDTARLQALLPYRVEPSKLSLATVESNVSLNFFGGYGPDFIGKTPAHMSVDTPWQYLNLLSRLKAIPNLRFATIRDALAKPPSGSEIVCTIRHDVDGDLVAAAQQAKIEQGLGIQTSYYVLHTAPYYGQLSNNVLVRNEVSAQKYREIQDAGHEIALHTDGMTLYQSHNIDGAAAIVEELRWLRSEGLNVTGSTAHNSFPVYGCNNYSIFKNRPLALRIHGGPVGVVHNGKWSPLQLLDEAELGLEYEANDLFWQEHTPLFYGCLMAQNDWHMEHNKHAMLTDPKCEHLAGTHDDLMDTVSKLEGPAYVKLVVHPMHYGFRPSPYSEPWLAEKPADRTRLGTRCWAGGGRGDEVAGTAITRANEFSTADRGLDCYRTATFRMAFFGHDNLATHRVSVDSKLAAITARLLRAPLRKPLAGAISVAAEALSVAEIKESLSRLDKTAAPDIIVVGLSEANPALNDMLAIVRQWRSEGRKVLCFLECGTDPVSRPAPETVQRIEATLGQGVVDPYRAFEAYRGSGRLFWDDRSGWAPQAHYLAAKALAQGVRDELSKAGAEERVA